MNPVDLLVEIIREHCTCGGPASADYTPHPLPRPEVFGPPEVLGPPPPMKGTVWFYGHQYPARVVKTHRTRVTVRWTMKTRVRKGEARPVRERTMRVVPDRVATMDLSSSRRSCFLPEGAPYCRECATRGEPKRLGIKCPRCARVSFWDNFFKTYEMAKEG